MEHQELGRRQFLTTLTKAMSSSLLINDPFVFPAVPPLLGESQLTYTVGEVISMILKLIPGAPFDTTVDTLKSGTTSQPVTGIITTMFATVEVIEQAIATGANFIIAHEPTFYNHADQTDWLQTDTVFRHKNNLLTQHSIAVWRFHDYWHAHRPDGIYAGIIAALGWARQSDKQDPSIITLPPMSLSQIIAHTKEKLGIEQVRVVGDMEQPCQRVLLLVGASGGRNQIAAIEKVRPDVVLCGEVSEWETPEYVRDARRQGQQLSLVILGHIMSEAAGMEWLVSWLKPQLVAVSIRYIPSGNPFTYA